MVRVAVGIPRDFRQTLELLSGGEGKADAVRHLVVPLELGRFADDGVADVHVRLDGPQRLCEKELRAVVGLLGPDPLVLAGRGRGDEPEDPKPRLSGGLVEEAVADADGDVVESRLVRLRLVGFPEGEREICLDLEVVSDAVGQGAVERVLVQVVPAGFRDRFDSVPAQADAERPLGKSPGPDDREDAGVAHRLMPPRLGLRRGRLGGDRHQEENGDHRGKDSGQPGSSVHLILLVGSSPNGSREEKGQGVPVSSRNRQL